MFLTSSGKMFLTLFYVQSVHAVLHAAWKQLQNRHYIVRTPLSSANTSELVFSARLVTWLAAACCACSNARCMRANANSRLRSCSACSKTPECKKSAHFAR
jgi:hypothetical protein